MKRLSTKVATGMSDQLEFLKRQILWAENGNAGSLTNLRKIVERSATVAPDKDLIRLAKCLVEIRQAVIESN